MRKKSGREKYLDSEVKRLDNAPPPPDWLLNVSDKAKRELNVSNEEKPGSNEKKSGRRLYEERVWREVDKMPPPPDWWPLEGRSKKNLISAQKTEKSVPQVPPKCPPSAPQKEIKDEVDSLKEKVKSLLEESRGYKKGFHKASIKDRLLCFKVKVRISLVIKNMLLDLARELGVSRSEAVRFCIVMCFNFIVKKERFLWQ